MPKSKGTLESRRGFKVSYKVSEAVELNPKCDFIFSTLSNYNHRKLQRT